MRFLWKLMLAKGRGKYTALAVVAWPLLLVTGLLFRELYLQTQHPLLAGMALACASAFVPFTLWIAQISME